MLHVGTGYVPLLLAVLPSLGGPFRALGGSLRAAFDGQSRTAAVRGRCARVCEAWPTPLTPRGAG
jgi:hypothetical protein